MRAMRKNTENMLKKSQQNVNRCSTKRENAQRYANKCERNKTETRLKHAGKAQKR